jgi:hypothetical protein
MPKPTPAWKLAQEGDVTCYKESGDVTMYPVPSTELKMILF